MGVGLAAVVLLVAVSSTRAIVCPPNFCDSVSCESEPNDTNCRGKLVPKTSYCGCCTTCQIEKGDGEQCSTILLGVPSWFTDVCKPASICVNNICVSEKDFVGGDI